MIIRPAASSIAVWIVGLAGALFVIDFFASSTCICGHGGLELAIAAPIFAVFALGGVGVAYWMARSAAREGLPPDRKPLGVALTLMGIGMIVAVFASGKGDMEQAHRDMFKPADTAVTSQVRF